LLGEIAASRHLTRVQIQGVVDANGLIRPDAAKAAKLVDRTAYIDEVIAELKKQTGRANVSGRETFKQISLADYIKLTGGRVAAVAKLDKSQTLGRPTGRGRIAVVYAEGDIVDGEGDYGEVSGLKFGRELRKLREDDDIKASCPAGEQPRWECLGRGNDPTRNPAGSQKRSPWSYRWAPTPRPAVIGLRLMATGFSPSRRRSPVRSGCLAFSLT